MRYGGSLPYFEYTDEKGRVRGVSDEAGVLWWQKHVRRAAGRPESPEPAAAPDREPMPRKPLRPRWKRPREWPTYLRQLQPYFADIRTEDDLNTWQRVMTIAA